MKKVMLTISGMTCGHCENAVKNALNKEGILEKSVSYKNNEAVVCFNPEQISGEAIVRNINQTGAYKVTGFKEC